jgi:Tol biopolymer transport system component
MRQDVLVIGRHAAIGLVLAALLGIGAVSAPAGAVAEPVPAGPRLGYLAWFDGYEHQFRVETVAPDRSDLHTLVEGERPGLPEASPNGGLSWSPDGSALAFTAFRGRTSTIWIVPAAGGAAAKVPGSTGAADPVFAPDGTTLAVARSRTRRRRVAGGKGKPRRKRVAEYSIWLLGVQGGYGRRLTGWSRAAAVPSSFTPDGTELGATLPGPHGGSEAAAIPLAGGAPKVIAREMIEPAFSPDGTRVALAQNTERAYGIYVAAADGSGLRKVSGRPGIMAAWDPSGQLLAFVVFDGLVFPVSEFGAGGHAYQVNADGSCERLLLGYGAEGIFSPVWEPGPERGAGPISC